MSVNQQKETQDFVNFSNGPESITFDGHIIIMATVFKNEMYLIIINNLIGLSY